MRQGGPFRIRDFMPGGDEIIKTVPRGAAYPAGEDNACYAPGVREAANRIGIVRFSVRILGTQEQFLQAPPAASHHAGLSVSTGRGAFFTTS